MQNILTIPKKMARAGDLVIVPRAEYEEALRVRRRLLWEEKDTDEAIRTFEKERVGSKLRRVSSFSEILKTRSSKNRR